MVLRAVEVLLRLRESDLGRRAGSDFPAVPRF